MLQSLKCWLSYNPGQHQHSRIASQHFEFLQSPCTHMMFSLCNSQSSGAVGLSFMRAYCSALYLLSLKCPFSLWHLPWMETDVALQSLIHLHQACPGHCSQKSWLLTSPWKHYSCHTWRGAWECCQPEELTCQLVAMAFATHSPRHPLA